MITPIFAAPADIEALIKIGIGVVLGIGWLIRFIASKNQAAAPPPQRRAQRPPAQRDEKIKNEIEVFLQEVTGRKAPPKQAEAARPVPQATEPRPTQARPQRPATVPQRPAARPVASPTTTSASPSPPVPQETASIRPGGAIAGRKGPGSTGLGTGVTSHLAEYMDEKRIEKQVQKDLQHTVNQEVRSHLGQFTAESATQGAAGAAAGSAGATHELVKLLRNPQGVRQAILIKEVLERPSARSRRRRG